MFVNILYIPKFGWVESISVNKAIIVQPLNVLAPLPLLIQLISQKGAWSVHSFNGDYISIQCFGSASLADPDPRIRFRDNGSGSGFIMIYFLLPGSRSKFPEVDLDPDPANPYPYPTTVSTPKCTSSFGYLFHEIPSI